MSKLRQLGANIVPVSLPNTKYALSAYYVLASSEASSNLARYDGIRFGTPAQLPIQRFNPLVRVGSRTVPKSSVITAADAYASTRSEGFGEEVQKRILLGTYALTAEYVQPDHVSPVNSLS